MDTFLLIISIFLAISLLVVSYLYWKKMIEAKREYKMIKQHLTDAESDVSKKLSEVRCLMRQQKILSKIINCANKSLLEDSAFLPSMEELAKEFRYLFESEYCSIGKVVNGIVEDYVVSYDNYEDEQLSAVQTRSLRLVRKVDIDNDNYKVCNALKEGREIAYYDEKLIDVSENRHYQIYANNILKSKSVKNTTIIPIGGANSPCGYLQFINSNNIIKVEDIAPFKLAMLQLMQLIVESEEREEELAENKNLLKDTNFFRGILENKDDVDYLLDTIMKYLSEQFNAAVISFRIPLLDGNEQNPIFYLRRCYISKEIHKSQELLNHYYNNRMLKNLAEMGGSRYLKCINGDEVIEDVAKDTDYYEEYGLKIRKETFILPILRDYSENKCHNRERQTSSLCDLDSFPKCKNRLEKFYGVFKLRLFDNVHEHDADNNVTAHLEKRNIEEKKKRLQYLSKQITILFNSIVERYENESLLVFQEKLKRSSFIKIKDFDQTCVETVKESIQAVGCVLYRYDDLERRLMLTAETGVNGIFKKKTISLDESENILVKIYKGNSTRYMYRMPVKEQKGVPCMSVLFVPMKKRDGTCKGVIAVMGKRDARHSVSSAYWEHDKPHVDFIVDVLNRISEADTERLVFLQQLSHELLIPIATIVSDNDMVIDTAERNKSSYTKEMLLDSIKSNRDRNMLFKYIVCDVENIYSTINNTIQYNMVMCKNPKELLLEAIRMLEKDAHYAKGISIVTGIYDMPPMYLDKDRIMQVFINLLKNAIRYSDKNSTIEVFYKFTDGMHEIKFVNYGIGIPIEDSEVIFDLFSRSKNAKELFQRGSGMGLYIVKGIMKAHGGDCVIRRHHQPTEISILLPNKKLNEHE